MGETLLKVENLKIYADGLAVSYPAFIGGSGRTKRGAGGYDRKNKISEAGATLSRQAARKIRSSIHYRFFWNRGNKNNVLKFYTFTIQESFYARLSKDYGEPEADKYFIKKLGMVLENYQKQALLRGYVWVAEKTKKGTIHFHCIFESGYVSARNLSTYWAKICGFEDYGNSVHYGFEKTPGKFEKTEIKGVKQLSKYLTKYVTKGAGESQKGTVNKIYGRVYGMSKLFIQSFHKSYHVETAIDKQGRDWYKMLGDHTELICKGVAYESDYGPEMYYVHKFHSEVFYLSLFFPHLKKLWDQKGGIQEKIEYKKELVTA
jgi:hypothetical protein